MNLLIIGGFINLTIVLFIVTKKVRRFWLHSKLDGLTNENFPIYLARNLFTGSGIFRLAWNFLLGIVIFGVPLWLISKIFNLV